MDADDSARMRDLLASNRTLLAWIRTSLGFAGLGFAVARFGLVSRLDRQADYLGLFLILVALVLAVVGLMQHRSTVAQERVPPGAPQPTGWPAVVAATACALTCTLLAVYLVVSLA